MNNNSFDTGILLATSPFTEPASSEEPLAWTDGLAAQADEMLGDSFSAASARHRANRRVGVQAVPLNTQHADQVNTVAGSAALDAVVHFLLRVRLVATGTELRAALLALTSANLRVLGLLESSGALVPPVPTPQLAQASALVASLAAAASEPPVAPAGSATDADPETSGTYLLKQFQPIIDMMAGVARKQQASLEATAQSRRQEMLLSSMQHAELLQLSDGDLDQIRTFLRRETQEILPPLEPTPT